MEYIDKSFLLRQAYFWLFDILCPEGNWKSDILSLVKKEDKKTLETLNWLQGVVDSANAPFIERSFAVVEEQMRNLFQNDIRLRALFDGFPIKLQSSVEFNLGELADRFELDVNLFRDLHEWVVIVVGAPYIGSLSDLRRYWVRIQELNTLGFEINGWSYEKDGDERVRLIKKTNFILGWLNLLSKAGIEKDKISRKAFERWRVKNTRGRAETSA